ncbi:MAG TPA: ABC transporter permease [Anaerolineae bacterium]|nr:ABC transporter permease [Anaerolineae bacterium]
MMKVWLIAQHHFLKEVRSRTFLLLLFALPLFLAFVTGFAYLVSVLQSSHTTLGYVDPAGWLANPEAGPPEPEVTLVRFQAEADAHQALEAGEVDAYYLLPAFRDARLAQLIYFEPPGYTADRYFQDLVRRNAMAGLSPALIERVLSGADVNVRATSTNREFPGGDPTVAHFLPLIAAAIFSFLVITTFGDLGEAVVTEKENRTVEVVVTSVSAGRLMAGKILGGLGIALLQLAVWIICLLLIVAVGGRVLEIEWLQNIDPNWRDVAMVVVVALPAYLFLAALTTAMGATLVEAQELQQVGGLAFFVLFLPLYLLVPLSQEPNGTLALVFSFFPFTSVATIALRCLLMEVPGWQVAVAAGIALASGVAMTWLAGKAFRANMLRYGQRLRLRAWFGRREGRVPVGKGRIVQPS